MPFQLLYKTYCREPHIICFKYPNPAWMVLCASTVAIQVVSRKRVEFIYLLLVTEVYKKITQPKLILMSETTSQRNNSFSFLQLPVARSLYLYSLLHNNFSFILFASNSSHRAFFLLCWLSILFHKCKQRTRSQMKEGNIMLTSATYLLNQKKKHQKAKCTADCTHKIVYDGKINWLKYLYFPKR